MTSDYEQRLWKRMDRLCPDASKRLSEIEAFPEEAAEAELGRLLAQKAGPAYGPGWKERIAAVVEAARKL